MSELDIPIDIHASKLLDWLISRKHVAKDWSTKMPAIRNRINEALNDMPQGIDMATLFNGSYINYFHCKEIVNALTLTKEGTKTVFGTYSSKKMNDWNEILRMYEKRNIFIAEGARLYYANLYYEIPAMKKHIQKLEQSQYDCEKREAELLKSHTALTADFKAECDMLGIKGVCIREELQAIVPELTNIYSEVVDSVVTVIPAVDLYRQFKAQQHVPDVGLSVLMHVIAHGNTVVYEYLYNMPPDAIMPRKLPYEVEFSTEFGDDEIDFGSLVVEDSPSYTEDNCIARGIEALPILDEPLHRDMFISDLVELQTFLRVRLSENSNVKDMAYAPAGSIDLAVESEEIIAKMLLQVTTLIEMIDGPSARKLHNIKHIPRYLEQLAVQLKNKDEAISKSKDKMDANAFQGKQACQQHKKLKDDFSVLLDKTRVLQAQIEESISHLYNGRPVTLLGNY